MPTRTPTTRRDPATSPRRGLLVLGAAVVVAVAAVAVLVVTRSAPGAVSIDAAVQAADDTAAADAISTATGTASTSAASSTSTDTVDGDWVVDTSIGEFSVADTTGSFVGFRIAEELANVGAVEAVGRTPDVAGGVAIDGTSLVAAEVTADLTGIVSDEPRREDAIQRALDTDASPTATFTASEAVEIGELVDGATTAVDVAGQLTVAGVTRDVVVPLDVARTGEVVVVTGQLQVRLAHFGITAPSAPIVVSVADVAAVELQLYLTRV